VGLAGCHEFSFLLADFAVKRFDRFPAGESEAGGGAGSREAAVGAAGGSPVAAGSSLGSGTGSTPEARGSAPAALAVVGLALRFALDAPPFGLPRAPLRARPTTGRKAKDRKAKGKPARKAKRQRTRQN